MSKHKPQDKQEVAKGGGGTVPGTGKTCAKARGRVSVSVPGLSGFGGKWKMQGGYQGRSQVMALCTLIRESGSILRGIWTPGGFLFVFVFVFYYCFHMQYKASVLTVHFPKFLQMYTPK